MKYQAERMTVAITAGETEFFTGRMKMAKITPPTPLYMGSKATNCAIQAYLNVLSYSWPCLKSCGCISNLQASSESCVKGAFSCFTINGKLQTSRGGMNNPTVAAIIQAFAHSGGSSLPPLLSK